MKIGDLKQGQIVWVKGYVDRNVFRDCGGFINFYNRDGNNFCHISKNNVREMKEEDIQLDQPKKEVPQMIFDVIESFDDDVDYLHEHIGYQSDEVREWLTHNERDFYEAWLAYPNITVEKEKSYQIIDKRLNATFSCLGYDIEDRVWFWGNKKFFLKNKGVRLAHTRQQLNVAGFEEVFENPNYEAKDVKNDL